MFRFRQAQLRLVGWQLYRAATYVNWCGHAQEFIPVPDEDGECRLIPVLGEATLNPTLARRG